MAPIQLDDSRHPVLLITVPPTVELEELDRHFDRIQAISGRGVFALVVDVRQVDVGRFSAAHRQRTADNFKRLKPLIPLTVSEAYVLDSPLARGALTAIQWLVSPRWPVQYFGDIESAVTWSRRNIEEHKARR